jgi:cytochrome b561
MIIMPASGIAMGYYGGKGLPFFGTTIPGVVKTDENKKSTGEIAKQVRAGTSSCCPVSFMVSPSVSASHESCSV